MAQRNDKENSFDRFGGVSRATPNTINGKWAENRGRRGGEGPREGNPFENGKLYNWNHRQGWDEYFFKGNTGRGPRGYNRLDSRIHDDACEFLTRNREVDASRIDVTVESGVVTLSGKVENREMKKIAGRLVENIPGVKDLHNILELDR